MELLHTLVAVHAEVFAASVLRFNLKVSLVSLRVVPCCSVFFFFSYSLFLDPSILKLYNFS